MKRLVIAVLFLGVFVSQSSEAIIGAVPSLTPAQIKLRDAASIRGQAERETALRLAIQETLLSTDVAARDQAFRYLSENSRWIDPRPFESLFLEFDRADSHGYKWGASLLDMGELMHGDREPRVKILRDAITSGQIVMRHGWLLLRDQAMVMAAEQGLDELEPLVTTYTAKVGKHLREAYHLGALPIVFSLRRGATTREEALTVAARRLLDIDGAVFRRRMTDDSEFRRIVIETVRELSQDNPFTHEKNPGFASLNTLVRREEQHTRQIAVEQSRATGQALNLSKTEDWLETLRGWVPPS